MEKFEHLFSPGKLLLTSEYFILDGALALAVPTKLGQDFCFKEVHDEQSIVLWEANHEGKPWLKAKIDYKNGVVLETNLPASAEFVLKVLKNVQKLSSKKLQGDTSYHIKTNLQFPSNFGLGSSSTLMNNLAEFAGIDAFLLNEISLGGSGYDIAVAQKKSAILYRNVPREVCEIEFRPPFLDELIFIHLNQKQDSREGISLYKSKEKSEQLISEFSEITQNVIKSANLYEFSNLMEIHEEKVSEFLGLEKVKDQYFDDCPFFVKSLGAWGGDFILSAKFGDYQNYFFDKGFPRIFEYKQIIY